MSLLRLMRPIIGWSAWIFLSFAALRWVMLTTGQLPRALMHDNTLLTVDGLFCVGLYFLMRSIVRSRE